MILKKQHVSHSLVAEFETIAATCEIPLEAFAPITHQTACLHDKMSLSVSRRGSAPGDEPHSRLTDLEWRIAEQEQVIADLNQMVVVQWRKIDALERSLGDLRDEFDAIALARSDAPESSPPHYWSLTKLQKNPTSRRGFVVQENVWCQKLPK